MPAMAAKLWASAQELLRTMMRPDIYDLWFAPLKATGFDGQVLTLQVANDFCEVWLSDNYLGLIREVLARTSGQPLHVQFQVARSEEHTSELQSRQYLVCRLLLEKKKRNIIYGTSG